VFAKLGWFGTVAIIILSRKAEEITIDSFVMSCRAMGFGLEQAFLRLVLDEEKQAKRAVGRYVPTDRNQPCARVFADNGFRSVDETNWLLDHGDERPVVPAWITVDAR
jgi:predicted enzyme involved in methoxymalonyl-ACP biosynthesis